MTELLTKDKIRSRTEVIDVPSWGGKVRIRALSPTEADEYLSTDDESHETAPFSEMAKVAVKCLVEPKFESVDEFDGMAVGGVVEIFEAVQKYSGFNDSAAVDEAEGNSEPTPGDSSPTG